MMHVLSQQRNRLFMAIPDYQSLMLPLLRLTQDSKEHRIGAAQAATLTVCSPTAGQGRLCQIRPFLRGQEGSDAGPTSRSDAA
jgi:hypothetical protein